MRIKAMDMERVFGLSQNGIRLYEKHGILHPARDSASRYRLYDEEDLPAMGAGLQFRGYGFTMQETGALLGGADESEQTGALISRRDALEQEIERLTRVRKSLDIQVRRIQKAHQLLDSCVLCDKPAMYFLGTLRDGEPVAPGMYHALSQWVARYTPHLSAALLLDGPYLTQTGYSAPPLRGVSVDAEIALSLGLLPCEQVLYLPPKPCVVTAVRFSAGDSLEPAFNRIRRYARENRLSLYAGGFIRQVQCVRRVGKPVQTGLLYAPLSSDERQFGGMR